MRSSYDTPVLRFGIETCHATVTHWAKAHLRQLALCKTTEVSAGTRGATVGVLLGKLRETSLINANIGEHFGVNARRRLVASACGG